MNDEAVIAFAAVPLAVLGWAILRFFQARWW